MIVVLVAGLILNMALPAMVHARDNGQAKACVKNLKNIMTAKEQYAMTSKATFNYQPVWSDISPYINSATQPLCPTLAGTTPGPTNLYQINPLNTAPVCPYGGPTGLPHVVN